MSLFRPVLGWLTGKLYGRAHERQHAPPSLPLTAANDTQSLPGQYPAQETLEVGSLPGVPAASAPPLTDSELRTVNSFIEAAILELKSQQSRLLPHGHELPHSTPIPIDISSRTPPRFAGILNAHLERNEDFSLQGWKSLITEMLDMAHSAQVLIAGAQLEPPQAALNDHSVAVTKPPWVDKSTDGAGTVQRGIAFLSFLVHHRPTYHPQDQRLRGQPLPLAEILKLVQLVNASSEGIAKFQAPLVHTAEGTMPPEFSYSGPGERSQCNILGTQAADKASDAAVKLTDPTPMPRKRKRVHLTFPHRRRHQLRRPLNRLRPSTAHAPQKSPHLPVDETLDEVTITRLIEFFASEKPHLAHEGLRRPSLGLLTPSASDEEDQDSSPFLLDAADRDILGLSTASAGSAKRKSEDDADKKAWKRLRIRNGRYASMFATDHQENDDPVIKPRSLQPRTAPPPIWAVDDELDSPRLRISSSKEEEIRLKLQQRHEKEEAARIEKLKREEEARRRREEAERQRLAEERRLRFGLRQPSRQVIAPMDETWQAKVSATLHGSPATGVVKSPEGTTLTASDFSKVVPAKEWLNDEIVNSSLIYLVKYINDTTGTKKCHAFNSFFWKQLTAKGAAGTVRWMKRAGVTKDNFLGFDTILIPICSGLHWTLVVVQPQQHKIAHMDSMGHQGSGRKNVTDIVHQWVKEFLQEKYTADWEVVNFKSPVQINGNDCGVHTITNAMFLALGLDPSFYRAEEMPLQRRRLAAVLLNGGFTGDFDLAGV
ncbi:uncharacterized protein E0L32_006434 [Thyridium curvatum]|uniref:Ubiquitin-like protease family profile domain-containing protein n=1 Tax=Thyridium curvatum TaxID=1093900 RepID=A0A507B3C5_9PEZI|nr:uncharacterized protein E0L32_006434 [Thyridium curvatum]TPX13234.1 hypothetical protein E0L32_006434 [Thyridium curvatum]